MKGKRLIIETSTNNKKALEKVLQEQGKTLTDWFQDKVEEAIAPYNLLKTNVINIDEKERAIHLQELGKSKSVLKKIQSQDWSFTEDNTTYLSHNIHPYPAKYIPQIPHQLIKILSLPGELIWDPFGGSGTTALESILLGRRAISSDINPIAKIIGQAKTKSLTKAEEDELKQFRDTISVLATDENNFNRVLNVHQNELHNYLPLIPNIEKWFHSNSLGELAYIRWYIDYKLCENSKIIALSAFSKIIVRVSFQDSETRYVSKPREVKFGSTLQLFCTELDSTLNKVSQLPSLLKFRDAKFVTANIVSEKIVEDNSIDLIVTSPPYPNATDYHLYHRFRIYWLGFDPKNMASNEIGSHLRHQRDSSNIEGYLDEMEQCLNRFHVGLRYGRYAVLVVGDAIFHGQNFHTAQLLADIAGKIGFEVVGIVPRKVHETKRSFVSAARRLRQEEFLILRKPEADINFELIEPPYKLWEYEMKLRKMEIISLLGKDLISNDAAFNKITINSSCVEKLRRLTFTHGFVSEKYAKEFTWQAILENGEAFKSTSNRKDPKYVTHGLHPYKGKFYPQLAKSLFNIANIDYGQKILDPFCGSGTVLLEGYLNGFNSFGFDLNPLAIKIARSKISLLHVDPFLIERLVNDFLRQLSVISANENNLKIFSQAALPELTSWFAKPILIKLAAILNLIDEIPERAVVEFLEICVSSIVREISDQDPKDLRIRRRKDSLSNAPVVEILSKKIADQLGRLLKLFKTANYCPTILGSAKIFSNDSRKLESFDDVQIYKNSIDAVITSPPYASALPYIDTDRLSILLLFSKGSKERATIEKSLIGAREISNSERMDVEKMIQGIDFKEINSPTARKIIDKVFKLNKESDVGFRRKNVASLLFRYYNDMALVFKNIDYVTKKQASIFFVIGDNKTQAGGEEIFVRSGKVLTEIGQNLGWELQKIIPITVTQENKLNNKNGITNNEIIWFKK